MQGAIVDIRAGRGADSLTRPRDEIVESWAFIYVRPATDPAIDRVEIERDGVRTTVVGVPEASAAVDVAIDLVEDGVQIIELCGILGPVGAARVIEATGGRVPVGAVSYGAESVARFLSWVPAGADYSGSGSRRNSGVAIS